MNRAQTGSANFHITGKARGTMSGDGLYGHSTPGDEEVVPRDVAATGLASVDKVAGAVTDWIDQLGRFLGVLQAALEQSRPCEDASAEVQALSAQLPALVRQCRAQVPTPEMIRTWVKTLSNETAAPEPVGADA